MMRLIDADALIKDFDIWYKEVGHETPRDRLIQNIITYAMDAVNDAETVDAVEVVRCKDCVHAGAFPNAYAERRFEEGMNCYLCRGDDGYGIANVSLVYPDDYCSDGVRREQKDAAD